jgi:glycosyltransferase involved in cell wall biosynthesis
VRILLLAHAPAVHTRRWAQGLQARGHELRLLSAHEPDAASGVPTRVVGWPFPISALRYASAQAAVRQEIRSFRPDVTVAHFLPNYGFLAAAAGADPWMLVCWGSDLLLNATRTPLHRARARWTLRRAQSIHVDAGILAEAAARLGAEPGRIWTRAWGVDVGALEPAEDWASRRARSGALRVLWTRRLESLYDPGTFIRGLGVLSRKGVDFRATLAGAGPLRPKLEARALREGISTRLVFTGWIEGERLVALYRSHDAYVSLSRSDSTSQSLLEGMAAGLVPVVSDIAGNREWVTHRREGLLVPVGDAEAVASALAEVARDPAASAAMADRARAAAASRARFEDTLAETEARLRAIAKPDTERDRLSRGGGR